MQRVLAKTISKLNISVIHSAINGFQGINTAIESKPDVIFLDLLMPELDGITTLKIIKSITLINNIPIIIITANSDFENLGTVLELGAAEFVAKPFTFATIQSKLNKVLENAIQKRKIEELNKSAYDSLNFEDDDIKFFNSISFDTNNTDTPLPLTEPIDNSNQQRQSYKNIAQKYSTISPNDIKKILDS